MYPGRIPSLKRAVLHFAHWDIHQRLSTELKTGKNQRPRYLDDVLRIPPDCFRQASGPNAAMAPKNEAPETPPSKGISSRLLTMKFMQRAVASESAQNSPQSASSSAKRRKVDSPLTGEFHSFDEAAIQAAIKQQEATRQAALNKHRVDQADTPWVLSGFSSSARPAKPRALTYVTFGSIDAPDASDAQEGAPQPTKIGRRKVGSFNSKDDKVCRAVLSQGEGSQVDLLTPSEINTKAFRAQR